MILKKSIFFTLILMFPAVSFGMNGDQNGKLFHEAENGSATLSSSDFVPLPPDRNYTEVAIEEEGEEGRPNRTETPPLTLSGIRQETEELLEEITELRAVTQESTTPESPSTPRASPNQSGDILVLNDLPPSPTVIQPGASSNSPTHSTSTADQPEEDSSSSASSNTSEEDNPVEKLFVKKALQSPRSPNSPKKNVSFAEKEEKLPDNEREEDDDEDDEENNDQNKPEKITVPEVSCKANNFTWWNRTKSFGKGLGRGIFGSAYLISGLGILYKFFTSDSVTKKRWLGISSLYSFFASYFAYASDFSMFSPDFSNWYNNKRRSSFINNFPLFHTRTKPVKQKLHVLSTQSDQNIKTLQATQQNFMVIGSSTRRGDVKQKFEQNCKNLQNDIEKLSEQKEIYNVALKNTDDYYMHYFEKFNQIPPTIRGKDLYWKRLGYWSGFLGTAAAAGTSVYYLTHQ